jgi:hypothetical protein
MSLCLHTKIQNFITTVIQTMKTLKRRSKLLVYKWMIQQSVTHVFKMCDIVLTSMWTPMDRKYMCSVMCVNNVNKTAYELVRIVCKPESVGCYNNKHICKFCLLLFWCICIHTLVSTMSCSYHLHTVQNTRIFHLKVFTYHHPFILTIHLKFPITTTWISSRQKNSCDKMAG